MTDDRFPPPAADDELLSAYLLGDVEPAAAEAFEARLAAEPELATRLNALADALVVMGGHDEVEEPAGLAERLDARLREVREPAPDVVSLDDVRERRARSRGWWTAVGTAAAVVAIGGVMATNVLRDTGMGDGGLAAGGADDAATTMDAMESTVEAPQKESYDADAGGSAARLNDAPSAAMGGAPAQGAPAPPSAPLLLDEQARVRGEPALRRRYADAPEVTALLGMPVDEATTLAAEFSAMVRDAGPFEGGEAPGDCLDTVTTAAEQPLVPARVESLLYQGRPALAYVLVTAAPESTELDRVETWVLAPEDCATVVFQQR